MDRKFAEILYSDPFESTQISAERPLDRARSPELRESAGESSLKRRVREREREREYFAGWVRLSWRGILARRAKDFIRYSVRERTGRSSLASSRIGWLGFFNPFTSCPPYPARPCRARSVARRDPPRS